MATLISARINSNRTQLVLQFSRPVDAEGTVVVPLRFRGTDIPATSATYQGSGEKPIHTASLSREASAFAEYDLDLAAESFADRATAFPFNVLEYVDEANDVAVTNDASPPDPNEPIANQSPPNPQISKFTVAANGIDFEIEFDQTVEWLNSGTGITVEVTNGTSFPLGIATIQTSPNFGIVRSGTFDRVVDRDEEVSFTAAAGTFGSNSNNRANLAKTAPVSNESVQFTPPVIAVSATAQPNGRRVRFVLDQVPSQITHDGVMIFARPPFSSETTRIEIQGPDSSPPNELVVDLDSHIFAKQIATASPTGDPLILNEYGFYRGFTDPDGSVVELTNQSVVSGGINESVLSSSGDIRTKSVINDPTHLIISSVASVRNANSASIGVTEADGFTVSETPIVRQPPTSNEMVMGSDGTIEGISMPTGEAHLLIGSAGMVRSFHSSDSSNSILVSHSSETRQSTAITGESDLVVGTDGNTNLKSFASGENHLVASAAGSVAGRLIVSGTNNGAITQSQQSRTRHQSDGQNQISIVGDGSTRSIITYQPAIDDSERFQAWESVSHHTVGLNHQLIGVFGDTRTVSYAFGVNEASVFSNASIRATSRILGTNLSRIETLGTVRHIVIDGGEVVDADTFSLLTNASSRIAGQNAVAISQSGDLARSITTVAGFSALSLSQFGAAKLVKRDGGSNAAVMRSHSSTRTVKRQEPSTNHLAIATGIGPTIPHRLVITRPNRLVMRQVANVRQLQTYQLRWAEAPSAVLYRSLVLLQIRSTSGTIGEVIFRDSQNRIVPYFERSRVDGHLKVLLQPYSDPSNQESISVTVEEIQA